MLIKQYKTNMLIKHSIIEQGLTNDTPDFHHKIRKIYVFQLTGSRSHISEKIHPRYIPKGSLVL